MTDNPINDKTLERVLPHPGEWFFWRIINLGEDVELQLRQYVKAIGGKRSWVYGTRRPVHPTPDTLNVAAKSLLNSLVSQQRNRENATRWAGDYPATQGESA